MNALVLAAMLAAFRVVGVLGQSGDVTWTDCAWCAGDANGDVYFPDGWVARKGARSVSRLSKTVPGRILSANGILFAHDPVRRVVSRVRREGTALVEVGLFARGVAATWPLAFRKDGSLLALDRKSLCVWGWSPEGASQGKVLDFAGQMDACPFHAIAEHPADGDLLLSTGWPTRIHRFRGGKEVVDGVWPMSAGGDVKVVAGQTWSLGSGATEVADSLLPVAKRLRVGGSDCHVTHDLAWTGVGWWLATSQGAYYCPAAQPTRVAARVGGLAGIRALAVRDGIVYAFAGARIRALRIDDFPDEPLLSTDDWPWWLGGGWSSRSIDAAVRFGDAILLREKTEEKAWVFDPSETRWQARNRRTRAMPLTEKARDLFAVCANRVRFRGRWIAAEELPASVSALTADDDYVYGYSQERRAILVFLEI